MTKKKPRYESRVFDGRIIHSAEIERIHKEVLDFKHIEAISEPMRELIEDLWPELANMGTMPQQDDHITTTNAGFGAGDIQSLSRRLAIAAATLRFAGAKSLQLERKHELTSALSDRASRALIVLISRKFDRLRVISDRLQPPAAGWNTLETRIGDLGHRLQATLEAIKSVYGPCGPPPGITEGIRFSEVNGWLKISLANSGAVHTWHIATFRCDSPPWSLLEA
jgi:hypothetical protein